MLKNVSGIGYDGSFFNNKLRVSNSVKYFYASMSSYQFVNLKHVYSAKNIRDLTYNGAITFPMSKAILLKASYERSLRLPEVEEAFGNFMEIYANPNLKPEKSDNFNLNVLFNKDKFDAEITSFYRNVSDLIFLETDSRGNGTSKNLNFARIQGVEASVNYHASRSLSLTANATYQDLRNRGSLSIQENSPRYFNARIPNIPYLLANCGITYSSSKLFNEGIKTQLWLAGNYTNEYFLYWEVDGDRASKNRIPTQFLQNSGLSLAFKNNVTVALECNNLSNQKTYDNFKVQLPGRSFSIKTRFYISKNNN